MPSECYRAGCTAIAQPGFRMCPMHLEALRSARKVPGKPKPGSWRASQPATGIVSLEKELKALIAERKERIADLSYSVESLETALEIVQGKRE